MTTRPPRSVNDRLPALPSEPFTFICHADEDKDGLVRPLVQELEVQAVNAWLDERRVQVGDTLPDVIGRALATCEFAIPVITQAFLRKHWPRRELFCLLYREAAAGRTIVLPVYEGVAWKRVSDEFPLLGDRFALDLTMGIASTAGRLASVVKGERGLDADLIDRAKEADYGVPAPPWVMSGIVAERDWLGIPRCRRCRNPLADPAVDHAVCEACALVSGF